MYRVSNTLTSIAESCRNPPVKFAVELAGENCYLSKGGEKPMQHWTKVSGLVIEPDGKISGIGVNAESENPPVDDPDQRGDAESESDD